MSLLTDSYHVTGSESPWPEDAVARLWSKVDKTGDCWLWTGAKSKTGYGRFYDRVNQRYVRAHVVVHESAHGPVPSGLEIDHLCRNRLCCKPDHLEAVTHAENMRRAFILVTTCHKGHPYTKDYRPGQVRKCQACLRAREVERYRRFTAGEVEVVHGRLVTYRYWGCRCTECVAANTTACRENARRRRAR